MAHIEIITINEGQATCSNYFFADNQKIGVGEVAFVPDEDLDAHIDTGKVRQVSASKAAGRVVNHEQAPKPGRKPNENQPGA